LDYNLSEVVIKELEVDILVKVLRGKERQIEKDLVLKKEKVYVPKNEALRVEIIQLYHDVLIVGYRRK